MILQKQNLRKIDDEEWKEVTGSNNRYYVSNYGRVKSLCYNKKDGHILKCFICKGFKVVPLSLNRIKRFYIHKLVAEVWIPKPSEAHVYVTHLDGNFNNNKVSNLEWHTKDTLKEFHREFSKLKTKTKIRPRIVTNSKLKGRDIKLIKSMLQRGVVQARIAKMFCISEMQITRIKRGENWGYIQLEKGKNEQ